MSEPLTDEQRAALAALASDVAPERWRLSSFKDFIITDEPDGEGIVIDLGRASENEARYVLEACKAVPGLIAEIDRLRRDARMSKKNDRLSNEASEDKIKRLRTERTLYENEIERLAPANRELETRLKDATLEIDRLNVLDKRNDDRITYLIGQNQDFAEEIDHLKAELEEALNELRDANDALDSYGHEAL